MFIVFDSKGEFGKVVPKNSKEATEKINDIFRYYGGQIPEACESLSEANKNLIYSMENEHPGKIMLFKYWPNVKYAEKVLKPYRLGKTKLYNFCCDFVIPSDSEHYPEFQKLVREFHKNGIDDVSILDRIADAVTKCGGYPVIWS